MEVYNENFFVGLDDYELTWELVADGRVVKAGRIGELDVAPRQRRTYTLGFTSADFCPQAKELLVMTDLSVGAVAVRVGFSSESNFSARFSAMTGQSPLQYRKSIANRP